MISRTLLYDSAKFIGKNRKSIWYKIANNEDKKKWILPLLHTKLNWRNQISYLNILGIYAVEFLLVFRLDRGVRTISPSLGSDLKGKVFKGIRDGMPSQYKKED